MINNEQELRGTLNRIERFRQQVLHLREVETNPTVYELSAGGFLAEIARMNLEVSEYLSLHPLRFQQEREKIAA
jgi:hypothetical protein